MPNGRAGAGAGPKRFSSRSRAPQRNPSDRTPEATAVIVSNRVENDLKSFREFIENRGQATGAWRGTIHE